jgi:drug/metabolite transporter (DMT)-like permease
VSSINHSSSRIPLGLDPVVIGTTCCIISAVGYTATNICLRFLADHANPVLVICVKELVTVAVVGPWLLYLGRRALLTWPRPQALVPLVVVGLATQLVANLGLLWSMSVVGLAVAIPAALGIALAGSAVLGRVLLGERVSPRSGVAVGLLVASIVLLKLGADRGVQLATADPVMVALAVGAACLAGVTFATLSVTIRHSVTGAVSPYVVVFVVTGMGVISMGPLSLWQIGFQGWAETPYSDFGMMLLAGAFNLIAFLAITKGLQLTTIVRANVLNASQVAMAALAGLFLFAEQPNAQLVLGICLTIAGSLLIDRADHESVSEAADSNETPG